MSWLPTLCSSVMAKPPFQSSLGGWTEVYGSQLSSQLDWETSSTLRTVLQSGKTHGRTTTPSMQQYCGSSCVHSFAYGTSCVLGLNSTVWHMALLVHVCTTHRHKLIFCWNFDLLSSIECRQSGGGRREGSRSQKWEEYSGCLTVPEFQGPGVSETRRQYKIPSTFLQVVSVSQNKSRQVSLSLTPAALDLVEIPPWFCIRLVTRPSYWVILWAFISCFHRYLVKNLKRLYPRPGSQMPF